MLSLIVQVCAFEFDAQRRLVIITYVTIHEILGAST